MLCTQYHAPIFLGFAGGTEPRSEGRSIKKCQPVPPDVAAWHRSRDKRGLSLSFSHSCRRLSKSGSNAAASDVNSANWLIEKTISLPTSACRSRKHAAKLPSPSGPCRREGAVHLRHARPRGRLAASHERTSSHSSRRIFPAKLQKPVDTPYGPSGRFSACGAQIWLVRSHPRRGAGPRGSAQVG